MPDVDALVSHMPARRLCSTYAADAVLSRFEDAHGLPPSAHREV